jgi:hypothetical protein
LARFERGLEEQEEAKELVTEFLDGKSRSEVRMYETVHNCDLFPECQRFSSLICKELNDFSLQWENDEILLPASNLGRLHLIPGLEAIYNRRVVIGCADRKADRLNYYGISIPPRGKLVRPVIRSDNFKLGYFFVPYENERRREYRRLEDIRAADEVREVEPGDEIVFHPDFDTIN